jgi:hypothetical protein
MYESCCCLVWREALNTAQPDNCLAQLPHLTGIATMFTGDIESHVVHVLAGKRPPSL